MRNFFRSLFRRPNPDYLPNTKIALVRAYLENSLTSFQMDPADTDYQRGYEAALKDLQDHVHDLDRASGMDTPRFY